MGEDEKIYFCRREELELIVAELQEVTQDIEAFLIRLKQFPSEFWDEEVAEEDF